MKKELDFESKLALLVIQAFAGVFLVSAILFSFLIPELSLIFGLFAMTIILVECVAGFIYYNIYYRIKTLFDDYKNKIRRMIER